MSYNNLYGIPNNRVSGNSNNCCNKTTITNNYYTNNNNNNKELIKVDTSNNYYLNVPPNDFNKIYEIFVLNSKDIYLPIVDNNLFIGFTIKLVNATGKTLNAYSQNNQLIYSNLYLPKQGNTSMTLNPNSLFVFCAIKKGDLFSWIMV